MKINTHLVAGFKRAVIVIVLYSISLALSTFWILPSQIPNTIFYLIVPVLTAFIAHDISPKITFVPGILIGIYFTDIGVGFFGGIIGGLLLGYGAYLLSVKMIINHPVYSVLLGYIIIGGLSLAGTYLVMRFLINPPILWFLEGIRTYISTIPTSQAYLLVGVLAFLTVLDLGGPFNKLAYTFILSFYLDGYYHLSGPIIISVALAPIALYIALKLYPSHFDIDDKNTSKILLLGALVGMTEAALPLTLKRPIKILPVLLIGSVITSVLAYYVGIENVLLISSIGGLFGVNQWGMYILLHLIGIVIIVGLLYLTTKQPRETVEE